MTATATVAYAAHPCPKCGAKLYDNRESKTNPKAPDFKCSNYKGGCDYVEWPPKTPKGASPKPPAPRTASSVDESSLPAELRPSQVEKEERAALSQKIGFDIASLETELTRYAAITDWYLDTVVPLLTKADVGCSPESVTAGIATIFIQTSKK